MSTVEELGKTSAAVVAKGVGENTDTRIWFKTQPVDRHFCYRAVQLQLETLSSDQGHDELHAKGCWSWFELAIYADAEADEPAVKNAKPLVWRSHGNRMDDQDTGAVSDSLHYGMVFDRRHDIFDVIEVGNVIAVHVCAKYAGWVNNAQTGRLLSKFLDYDLFSPMSWNLGESLENDATSSETLNNGVYTLTPPTESHIISKSDQQTDAIWFTTPSLDEYIIPKLQDIQLFTVARQQGNPPQGVKGNWSWFDLVILETPESKVPVVRDGQSLVWRSHDVPIDQDGDTEQHGDLFGPHYKFDIFAHLKPGNVIGVRPSTRFKGWELHARYARLVVRVSTKGPRKPPSKPPVNWAKLVEQNKQLQAALEEYLDKATGKRPAAGSIETTLLTQELRADWEYGFGKAPLRILSLDGGGVRGIASLYILKDIMSKVSQQTGEPIAKPCDYFDMMAGTSTGGLIAIMLGRLRMSIDECIEAYQRLATDIFGAGELEKLNNASDTGARYSGEALENAIKSIVKEKLPTGNPDELMKDPLEEKACKVFVLTCRADDLSNSVATHMRTYTNGNVEKSFDNYKIWEAARATSAAPTYFPRIKLGDHEYIDGGIGFNNPILLVMGEARLLYGFAREIGCLVTIGTGMKPNVALPDVSTNAAGNIISAGRTVASLLELATTTEAANVMAQKLVEPFRYYRFNLGTKIAEKRWLETVSPTAWKRWALGAQDQTIEHYTPENWANVAIALDDYKEMETFGQLAVEYMKIQGESEKSKTVSAKLPPKRAA